MVRASQKKQWQIRNKAFEAYTNHRSTAIRGGCWGRRVPHLDPLENIVFKTILIHLEKFQMQCINREMGPYQSVFLQDRFMYTACRSQIQIVSSIITAHKLR